MFLNAARRVEEKNTVGYLQYTVINSFSGLKRAVFTKLSRLNSLQDTGWTVSERRWLPSISFLCSNREEMRHEDSMQNVMVHSTCHFDWAKGCPDDWQDIASGRVSEMFLDDISIGNRALEKEDPPCPVWQGKQHLMC